MTQLPRLEDIHRCDPCEMLARSIRCALRLNLAEATYTGPEASDLEAQAREAGYTTRLEGETLVVSGWPVVDVTPTRW